MKLSNEFNQYVYALIKTKFFNFFLINPSSLSRKQPNYLYIFEIFFKVFYYISSATLTYSVSYELRNVGESHLSDSVAKYLAGGNISNFYLFS